MINRSNNNYPLGGGVKKLSVIVYHPKVASGWSGVEFNFKFIEGGEGLGGPRIEQILWEKNGI